MRRPAERTKAHRCPRSTIRTPVSSPPLRRRNMPAVLVRWHARGAGGGPIKVSRTRQPEAGLSDALRPKIVRTAAICRELGWHLDLLLPGWLIGELMPTLRDLPVAFTVAHMGLFPA